MLVSEGFKYALTCVDTATGLLQAFTYKQTTGKATLNALTQLRGVCEHTKEWAVKRTNFTNTNLQNWVRTSTSNAISIYLTTLLFGRKDVLLKQQFKSLNERILPSLLKKRPQKLLSLLDEIPSVGDGPPFYEFLEGEPTYNTVATVVGCTPELSILSPYCLKYHIFWLLNSWKSG